MYKVKEWSIVVDGKVVFLEYVDLPMFKHELSKLGSRGYMIKRVKKFKNRALIVYELKVKEKLKPLNSWLR